MIISGPVVSPLNIGRYHVQRTIGRGAMGVVYEAHDPVIDRKVAIKLIRADLLEGGERDAYLDRFRREAQAAGRCNHPSIVAVFDFAMHEGNPFLAMEYVEGLGVDKALAQGERFSPAAASHVILQVLDALACAHGLGIVHRDIKPANILLVDGGRVKVMDFGIARLDSSELTHAGMVIGTPSYMSPEQCRGEEVDLRSDLFSTATVLQEMLIGQRPFRGGNFTEISYNLLNGEPGGAAELAALVGTGLQSALHRALAKRPADRFPSAVAMADALREAIGGPTSLAAAEAIDKTVMAVRSRVPAVEPASGSLFDQVLLGSVERSLARRIGPIARYMVQNSLRTAASMEGLCDELARRIDHPGERQEFLSEALGVVRSGAGRRSGTGLVQPQSPSSSLVSPNESERARRALAETLGPIAKILVQRALGQARTPGEFWDLLASHIGPAAERAAFLRRRDDG